jgi:Flp pilus assembly protein TadD
LRVNANGDALRELQALVVRYQNSPHEQGEAYATIGQLYNRQGKTREALDMLAKARQLSPDNVGILNYYAQCLDRSGQRDLAKQVYRDALAKDPGNAETLNNLAFLLADLGTDLDQALTLANRAKQKVPNMVEVSDTIGWIYLKKNLSDSATDVFRDLNAKVPNNPTFHLHYCMALAQKGDRAAASKECKTAMGLNPPPEDAAQLRELLAKLG